MILVIIPAYNEEDSIRKTVEGLRKACPDVDYIIVNDGSGDATERVCREQGFPLLNLPVNLGLAGAFQAGMRYAYDRGYECALQFDGDGQHDPLYIRNLKGLLDKGFDIVILSRYLTEKKPLSLRMLGSRLLSAAIRLTTGVRITDPTSGMRMYGKKAIGEFALRLNYGPEPDTISYLLKQGMAVAEIQGRMREREGGKSYLTPLASARYMLHMLVSILFIQNFRKR